MTMTTNHNIKASDIKTFDENKFIYFPIYIEAIENEKKEIKKVCIMPKDWNKTEKSYIKPLYISTKKQELLNIKNKYIDPNGIAILTEESNISVIDVDKPKECPILDNLLNDCKFINKTKKGYHFIFKNNDLPRKKICNIVDINTQTIYYVPEYKYNGEIYGTYQNIKNEGIEDMPDYAYNYCLDMIKTKGIKKEKQEKNHTNNNNNNSLNNKLPDEEKYKLLNLIDVKYLDNYELWRNLIWAMKNEGYTKEDAISISKKSNKYDDEGFNNVWDKAPENITITQGTINKYARESNQQEYFKIQNYGVKNVFNDFTDEGLAQIVADNLGTDLVFQNEDIYIYYNDVWIKNDKHLCKQIFTECLRNIFNTSLKILTDEKIKNTDENNEELIEKKIKGILGALKEIKKVKTKNNILEAIKGILSKRCDKIEFDDMPYLMMFNNGVYNFKTKEFLPKNKQYYLTISTGYDYDPNYNQENYKIIDDLFNKVFPIEEEKKLYGCLLMRSYIGINLDKFIIANGSGGNGKSVIHNLNSKSQGNYSYTFPASVLSKPIKDGPNPEIAGGSKKRFICCEEADEKLGLCNSTIKNLTGGRDGVRARMCNSNNTEFINTCSLFNNCNEKPKLQGTITQGEARRLIDFPFRSSFTFDEDKIDEDLHIYKADNRFINDEEFIQNLRNPYFNYLVNNFLDIVNIDNFNIESVMPESIKQRTLQYLSDCDFITNWFMENYEKTNDETDILQMKEVYEWFKISDVYNNMNKKDKRTYNKNHFIEKIQTNIILRHYYKEREQRREIVSKYGVMTMRNIIWGFKLKQNEDEDNYEEETP